ncbi:MAG: CHAD domain-containing protein [Pseudomonadota bacterium]
MTFRLALNGPIADDVRTVWQAQLRKNGRRWARPSDLGHAIHASRKSFKRMRALIRLIAPAIRKRDVKTENVRYRDLGRSMAVARDAQVMGETLDALATLGGLQNTSSLRAARSVLAERLVAARNNTDVAVDPSVVRDTLSHAATAVSDLDLQRLDDDRLADGFAKAYAKARAGLKAARSAVDDEVVHDWRKDVQTHWRHCALLEALWPEQMVVRIETARQISHRLGFDHDLCVLMQFFEQATGEGLSNRQAALLIERSRQIQLAARAEAICSGRRLLATPTGAMRTAVRQWLAITREEVAENRTSLSEARETAIDTTPMRVQGM